MFITKTRQVQLLHVLSRQTESCRNSDGDRTTRENVVSSWGPPVTITRFADRDTVIRLVCTEPGCQHREQDVRVKSIRYVAVSRLWRAVVAIICFAIGYTGGLGL